jgi:hypothetical protein
VIGGATYPVYPHYTCTPPEEGWVVQAGTPLPTGVFVLCGKQGLADGWLSYAAVDATGGGTRGIPAAGGLSRLFVFGESCRVPEEGASASGRLERFEIVDEVADAEADDLRILAAAAEGVAPDGNLLAAVRGSAGIFIEHVG